MPVAVQDYNADLSRFRPGGSGASHVVLRRAINPVQVRGLAESVLEHATRIKLFDDPEPGDPGAPSGRLAEVWSDQRVHQVGHSRGLVDAAAGLFGEDVFVHPRQVIRCMRSADNARLAGWHQDWPEVQGSRRALTAWLPLRSVDVGRGALEVSEWRGGGVRDLRLAERPVGWECDTDDEGTVRCGPMEPGDVLLFDALTVHRGGPCQTSDVRLSMDVRLQPWSDPVCTEALSLASMGTTWDEVYAGWTGGPQHYWQDRVATVPLESTFDEWRAYAALHHGAVGDPRARRGLYIAMVSHDDAGIREAARALLAEQFNEVYEFNG